MVGFSHRHKNVAFDVVVNNARDRACVFGLQRLIFKGVVATADKRDFAFYVDSRIIYLFTYAGNGNVFVYFRFAFGHAKLLKEVVGFPRYRVRFREEENVAVVCDDVF